MYFKTKDSDKKIIRAEIKNGPYIVLHIAKSLQDRKNLAATLASTEINHNIENNNTSNIALNDKKRYLLWHRRFTHVVKEKIRTLYKVATIKYKISIPSFSQDKTCEVYTIIIIRNKIDGTLSP